MLLVTRFVWSLARSLIYFLPLLQLHEDVWVLRALLDLCLSSFRPTVIKGGCVIALTIY